MIEGIRNFVSPRAENLVNAVCIISNLPSLTLSALLFTASDLVSLGKNTHFMNGTKEAHNALGLSVWNLSLRMIYVINPKARSENWDLTNSDRKRAERLMGDRIELEGIPSHVAKLAMKQQEIFHRLYEGNRFEKHVETRLFSLVSGSALAITGVALTVFGAVATVAAMMTFGSYKKVNSYAINNIQAIGFALNRLHLGVLGALNPGEVARSPELESVDFDDEELRIDSSLQEYSMKPVNSVLVRFSDNSDDDDEELRIDSSLQEYSMEPVNSVVVRISDNPDDADDKRNDFVFYRVLSGAALLGVAALAANRWVRA